MIDQNDLDYWVGALQHTTMTKRELERYLRDAGLTRQMSKIIASKCGRKYAESD
jgi:hypothetical protein